MQRRTVLAGLTALAMLTPLSESATDSAVHHHPATGCPNTRQLIVADSQAEVYFVGNDYNNNLRVSGCAYKTGRPFTLVPCGIEHGGPRSRSECEETVRLAGIDVAFEFGSSFVVVRNLDTGRTLHKVPTGSPLRPIPEYVGVGNVVALLLKSDGAAAWIAEDDERSTGRGSLHETLYFDVEAVDASGTRLLAAGTDIDRSSLALATGGSSLGQALQAVEGNTVYWTQDGKPFSAPLN